MPLAIRNGALTPPSPASSPPAPCPISLLPTLLASSPSALSLCPNPSTQFPWWTREGIGAIINALRYEDPEHEIRKIIIQFPYEGAPALLPPQDSELRNTFIKLLPTGLVKRVTCYKLSSAHLTEVVSLVKGTSVSVFDLMTDETEDMSLLPGVLSSGMLNAHRAASWASDIV